jgi:YD repeat-containing protein
MVRTTLIVPALLVGLALGAAPLARAAETEVRTFNVSVDGKPSGQYKMTITRDGAALSITCDAHVKVKVLGVTAYSYDFYGVEEWKDGKLQSLRSRSNDDGKKFDVTASAGEKGLTVKINGREKTVRGDVYLTTACCLPDAKRRDGDLPLMESDNGQEINGKIQQVSSGPMTVCGESVNVTRYRLTSGTAHDVWYDGADRMVRQEWTEDGHKTVLELAGVKKQ